MGDRGATTQRPAPQRPGSVPTRVEVLLLAPEENSQVRMAPDGRSVAFQHDTGQRRRVCVRSVSGDEVGGLDLPADAELIDARWTSDGSYLVCHCRRQGRSAAVLIVLRAPDFAPLALERPLMAREFWLAARRPELLLDAPGEGGGGHHLARVDLRAATVEPVPAHAGGTVHRWLVDGELRVRGYTTFDGGGALSVVLGGGVADGGRTVCTIGPDSVADFRFEGFSRSGRYAYMLSSHAAPARRLLRVDCETLALSTVFEDPLHDVDSYPIAGSGVWFDPLTGEPDLCSVIDQRIRYAPLRPGVRARLVALLADPGDPLVLADRSADDETWLSVRVHTDGPIEYLVTSAGEGRHERVFHNRPALRSERLARLEDFVVRARDGLALGGFAMRPPGVEGPAPGVVLVHGGPAGRDYWRFHAVAQYFAALGLASLHVNYRGSRGYGQTFRAAGYGEWGAAMQEDLYDAVREAVRREVLDPSCVVFYGSSYGGYAALLAACTRGEVVRGAVAISPPADLVRFASRPPRFWRPLAPVLQHQLLGPDRTVETHADWLAERSPLHRLSPHCAPVLVAHGARDPRVPVEEVDAFVERARSLGVDVRYERFEDEGHEIRRPDNRLRVFEAVADLLADLTEVRHGERNG